MAQDVEALLEKANEPGKKAMVLHPKYRGKGVGTDFVEGKCTVSLSRRKFLTLTSAGLTVRQICAVRYMLLI